MQDHYGIPWEVIYMMNELKKIILAGIGSAAYTYDKAAKVIEELVKKGKLTIDEGKELSEELKKNFSEKAQGIKPLTKDDMSSLLKEMNFATKDDLENIKARLAVLEEKINKE